MHNAAAPYSLRYKSGVMHLITRALVLALVARGSGLAAYACPMRCPVLTARMGIQRDQPHRAPP
eukprot:542542-Rhodomonas_salina.3